MGQELITYIHDYMYLKCFFFKLITSTYTLLLAALEIAFANTFLMQCPGKNNAKHVHLIKLDCAALQLLLPSVIACKRHTLILGTRLVSSCCSHVHVSVRVIVKLLQAPFVKHSDEIA